MACEIRKAQSVLFHVGVTENGIITDRRCGPSAARGPYGFNTLACSPPGERAGRAEPRGGTTSAITCQLLRTHSVLSPLLFKGRDDVVCAQKDKCVAIVSFAALLALLALHGVRRGACGVARPGPARVGGCVTKRAPGQTGQGESNAVTATNV